MPSSRLTTGGLTNTKNFSPRGAPLFSTSANGLSASRSASSARIGDGRRRADELRIRSVVPADALQAAQHVGQVAAEHAAIRVQLVDDDEVAGSRTASPSADGAAGCPSAPCRDCSARCARACEWCGAHPAACRRRRCARRSSLAADLANRAGELVQLRHLILRERLGREQIQRARRRILQDAIENRQVVAERLARRRRRGDDDLPAGGDVLERFGLVRVELARRRAIRTPRAGADRSRPETARRPPRRRAAAAPR